MVKQQRSRISKPPVVAADNWVSSGGIDPEIQSSPAPLVAQPEEVQGKPYPHRISLDLSEEQYERLKLASFKLKRSMNEILREAADSWLKAANY